MKHISLAFAGVVAGSMALSAQADTSWWSESFSGYADIQAMTNDFTKGTWTMREGDTSYLAASYSNDCAAAIAPTVPSDVLVLNTESQELTFAPTNATPVSDVTVVDADVFFVGSDAEPNLSEDTTVQFALFLKVPEDTGANGVSNSVMVYVNPELEGAEWVALPNTNIGDKTWHHVQVRINYPESGNRKVSVWIDGSEKTPENGYVIANGGADAPGLNSVSFKGTGAVDNFTGGFEVADAAPTHTFTAAAYVDGALDQTIEIGDFEAQAGTDASFEVPRTVGTKTITNIVVKAFETGSDVAYAVTDDGTDFTVTPTGLDFDATDPDVVFINVPTDDAAETGAPQTYPALEVYYGDYTPPPAPTAFQKYFPGAQGSGTALDPYQIPSYAALCALQEAVASNDVDCVSAYYVQTASFALEDAWPGIGVQNGKDLATGNSAEVAQFDAGAFKGTYDGGDYTISNFQMVDGLDYCGLFNSVSNATIKNLKVSYKDGNFAKDMAAANDACGATFVGVAKGSTLQNLTTLSGSVSCTKGFGGIVGFLMAGSTVDSCTNNVNLTSTKTNKAGGIAMITQGGTGSAIIRNCQNNGTTTGNASQKGGIVGYVGVATTIENCEDTAGSTPSILHTQNFAVTVQGVNKAPANVVSYTNSGSTPVDGLAFATLDNDVATFVKVADLAAENTYKVMGANATATYEFTAAGSISFDTNLVQAVTFNITVAQGLKDPPTETTADGVVTFTARALATPTVTVNGGANATAAWTVNGTPVATVPATLTEGDTYGVVYTADAGYKFADGATTTTNGTAGTENIAITISDAVALATPTVTVIGGANATAAWTVNGVSTNAPATLTEGDTYEVVYTADAGYEFAAGAVTNASGTAGTENIEITISDAVAISPAEEPKVDIGGGLADYTAAHPGETVPPPVAMDNNGFNASFVAPVAGYYCLMTASTPSGDDADYAVDASTAEYAEAGALVTLTDSNTSATSKFYKIGYSATEISSVVE